MSLAHSCTYNLTSHFIFSCCCFLSNPIIVSEKCVFMFLILHWLVLTIVRKVIPYYSSNFGRYIIFLKKYSLSHTHILSVSKTCKTHWLSIFTIIQEPLHLTSTTVMFSLLLHSFIHLPPAVRTISVECKSVASFPG